MANNTFSAQFQQQQQLQNQPRATRTERKLTQDIERKNLSKYQALQQEAERLKTQFVNYSFAEYTTAYNKLSPDLKQFFASPSEVTAENQAQVQREKDRLLTNLTATEQLMKEAEGYKQEHIRWFQALSSQQQSNERKYYLDKLEEYNLNVEQYYNEILYAKQQASKLDQGASFEDVWNYAKDKAYYERSAKEYSRSQREKFAGEVATGNLDKTLTQLGLNKANVTYQQFAEKYEYQQGLVTWSNKVGFTNLPAWTQAKLNPTAVSWQKQNPTEKLNFDKFGNVIGVTSGYWGKTFNIADYDKQVARLQDYNNKIEAENLKQNQSQTSSEEYLKNLDFGKDVSLTPKKQNVFGIAWTGLKNVYLTSLLGTGFSGISETKQKELTALREESVRNPKIDFTLASAGIFAPKFATIDWGKGWTALQEQRASDYRAVEKDKLLKELTVLSEGGGQTSNYNPELKPYIMAEGIKILESKGLKTTKTLSFGTPDEFGNIPTTTVTTITDPDFDRRLSQNMLEWENELIKDKTIDKGFWQQLKPTSLRKGLLETRVISSKAIESYGVIKGVGYGIKGVGMGYKALGLPTVFTKTVQLQEGTAIVKRDFALTKTLAGLGLTGVYGVAKYSQYKTYTKTSKGGASLFALETAGELGGIELSTGVVEKSYTKLANKISNMGKEKLKIADISNQGFMRENKRLGMQERVYMDRYKGFKLSKPKSWLQTIEGYEKGQFTGTLKKKVADEVVAYYKYGGDVIIRQDTGEVRIVKATPFPFDKPSTHLKWFTQKNVQEFGTGKYSELPIKVKGKALGFSATGNEWPQTKFDPNKLFYYDDSGVLRVLNTKGEVQYFSGKGVSAGFLRLGKGGLDESSAGKVAKKPIIYEDWFTDVKINKAIKEIRATNLQGRELKAYIYAKDTGQAGTLNIGRMKKEVEGTAEISERILLRNKYKMNWLGWDVPIQEDIITTKSGLSSADLKGIIKGMGGIKELPLFESSYLPSSSFYSSTPAYSLVSFSSPSKSYSKVMSKISKMSGFSNISKVPSSSKVSKIDDIISPMPSRASSFSPSSVVSDIMSKVSYTSRPYVPPKSKVFSSAMLESELLGKVRKLRKKRKSPELMGLFPDFTSRAIGLNPKEYSVKDALKEIRRVQTGFEVRRGGRIKGFSPVSEKSLLKDFMK